MATFYVLPPRSILGDALARVLQDFFPGLDWPLAQRQHLVETLTERMSGRNDVYVVFRDDLPLDELLTLALVDAFGAEQGDEVVEIRCGSVGLTSHRWPIEGRAAA